MKNILPFLFLGFLLLAAPAAAKDDNKQSLTQIDTGIIKEILKSDLILLDNNKRYKLDNILVPVHEEEPAVTALKTLLLNKQVVVYTYHEPNTAKDRYGIPLAHVFRDDGIWVQGDLVSKGLAWAFSSETSREMTGDLKLAEANARAQNLGFWANADHAVKTPYNLKDSINSFQIVEGKVMYVTARKEAIYLNFGREWKEDFTIELPKDYLQFFVGKTGGRFDPEIWKDRIVRVRGWVEEKSGPMITLTHLEQIDIIK